MRIGQMGKNVYAEVDVKTDCLIVVDNVEITLHWLYILSQDGKQLWISNFAGILTKHNWATFECIQQNLGSIGRWGLQTDLVLL